MNRFYSMTEMKQLNQQDIADYISKSMEKLWKNMAIWAMALKELLAAAMME